MDIDEEYVIPLLMCYDEVKTYDYNELKDYINDLDIPTNSQDYQLISGVIDW